METPVASKWVQILNSTKEDQNNIEKELVCSENWKDGKESHYVLTTAKCMTTSRIYLIYLKLGYFAARKVRDKAPGEKTRWNLSVQPSSVSVVFLLSALCRLELRTRGAVSTGNVCSAFSLSSWDTTLVDPAFLGTHGWGHLSECLSLSAWKTFWFKYKHKFRYLMTSVILKAECFWAVDLTEQNSA